VHYNNLSGDGVSFLSNNRNARETALQVLLAVESQGAYANLALRSLLDRENAKRLDRAFATELVYGTLRSLNSLDWVLDQFLKKPLVKQTPVVRNVLRLGLYQILYMDRVPDSAACNESANLARRYENPGAVKFVNGVLRNVTRKKGDINFPDPNQDAVKYISLKYSHPQWIVQRWVEMYGLDEATEICKANNNSAPTTVRTNTLKVTREELTNLLKAEGLDVTPTILAPEGLMLENVHGLGQLKAFKDGLMQVQDESSMLVGHALAPEPGTKVLDMASAPGGKTTHLAQLMGDKGEITACDIHAHKLKLVKDNCRRLGITIVNSHWGDARNLSDNFANWADYVLLDAPCSGLGVLRRRPDARWRKDEGQIKEIAVLQKELLEEAGKCLKPGGVMVYSTCTITHEENTDLVKGFLASHENFCFDSLEEYLPKELRELNKGYVQLLPHQHHTDGFFIARLHKKRD